ncbi:hypothetical protein WJX84_011532 [Apatococcus fuscideae]|uniref:Uncharacterized protein n=1 Tax=Apatococcus fuscideae TaxID=2026836 RepID=A0AAW1TIA6_9CHLO
MDQMQSRPFCVMHGTYLRHLQSIRQLGLLRGARQHIHLTPFQAREKAVMSGFRSNCEVPFHLNTSSRLSSADEWMGCAVPNKRNGLKCQSCQHWLF